MDSPKGHGPDSGSTDQSGEAAVDAPLRRRTCSIGLYPRPDTGN